MFISLVASDSASSLLRRPFMAMSSVAPVPAYRSARTGLSILVF